jgi:transaldolase
MAHFYSCLAKEVDIITAPLQVLSQWVDEGMVIPSKDYVSTEQIVLDKIVYQNIDLANTNWRDLDISHDLTTKGLLKFASDWESLI